MIQMTTASRSSKSAALKPFLDKVALVYKYASAASSVVIFCGSVRALEMIGFLATTTLNSPPFERKAEMAEMVALATTYGIRSNTV